MGPFDFDSPLAPRDLALGVVGSEETIEGLSEWLQRVGEGTPAKSSNQPNLFRDFPGCALDVGFRTSVTMDSRMCHSISKGDLSKLAGIQDRDERISEAVDVFIEGVRYPEGE